MPDSTISGTGPQGGHGPPDDPLIRETRAFLEAMDPWVLERQMELSAIPAPPFGEGPRGRRMADLLLQAGLASVVTDGVGNVIAELSPLPGTPTRGPLVVSAHLDTVFPEGTEVTPRRTGDLIRGPGICDDGRGLAALLAVARTLRELGLPLPYPVLFVATVGEEGIGNLRGVQHLFREMAAARTAQGFISLDGIGLDRIIVRGVGSTRLRVGLGGQGGHSWTDWGRPNPIHALGRAVARAQDIPLPGSPRTTLTVARWGGGQSINAIPQEAWAEVDLRSEGTRELVRLEEGLLAVLEEERGRAGSEAAEEEELRLDIQELGRRPSGATDPGTPLVKAAAEATRALGVDPQLTSSSTDANVPMALGIPAITLGAGGSGGGFHTPEEWYRNENGPEGILRAILTLLLLG